MKIILTEQQYKYICEQQNLGLKGKTLAPKAAPPKRGVANPEDTRKMNQILQIATAFIPVVGPFISAGIGLADAYSYHKQGDTKTAALVAAFSLLPAVGSIPAVKQLGARGMSALAEKISRGAAITDATELAVVNGISTNLAVIQRGLSSQVRALAQQGVARTTNNTLKSQLTKLAKDGVKEIGGEYVSDKSVEVIRSMI
jgi:hypothetical protein